MKKIGKKVLSHLKEDVRDEKAGVKREKHRMVEDKELMKSIKDAHEMREGKKRSKKAKKSSKIEKTMHEFKEGELHSGSKKGPKVTNRKQAVAIALNQARKAGKKVKSKKK